MGGAGDGSHTWKLWTFFLLPLTLRMSNHNKKIHRTQAEECRKVFVAIFTTIKVVIFPQLLSTNEIFCCGLTYVVSKILEKMTPTLKNVTHPQPRPHLCRYSNFPLTRKMNRLLVHKNIFQNYQLSSLKNHKISVPLLYYTFL